LAETAVDTSTALIAEADPALLEAVRALAAEAPLPARFENIDCGTAGWTDKTLIDSRAFYPKVSMPAKARLEHYATHFNMVEVDSTYYALLPPSTAVRWLEATPDDFTFDIKAHPVVTGHPIDIGRLPKDLKHSLEGSGIKGRAYRNQLPDEIANEIEARFMELLGVLQVGGKPGCVIAQFPPWFGATRGNARAIEALRARWQETPISVEFRNPSWLETGRRDRVFDLLRANQMIYVVVDEPDVKTGGVPPIIEATHPDLAIVRFHGHNASGWRRGASVWERFNYLYSPPELATWVPKVRKLAERAGRVQAIFNNCVRDYAVVDAKGLSALLVAG
jgi:uncharacterized protein YecE (DUF72 family)